MNGHAQQEKHPPGLYVLFFTEMWERFGFYTMGAMFAAYLRDDKQGFGWSDANAQILTSVYLALVYASPVFGGLIADRGLGYRNAVLLGGVIFMVGYLLFGFPTLLMVFAALACLIIGNGFFKPNVSAMVGHQYPEGSSLKDRAFNIFYMGINVGAFFAPLVADYVSGQYGFRPAFMVASGGMVISVATLWFFRHSVHEGPMRSAQVPVGQVAAAQNPMDAIPDSRRIGALLVVFLIVIVFWMVFHQNSSTLVFWALDNTDWTGFDQLTGRKSSGILANSINAFFVVAFTFPLVWVWKRLNERGLEPATPTKMALGMFLTAASFFLLYWAALVGERQELRPEAYPTADYRVTDLVLENLRSTGVVDAELVKKIEDSKDSDDKPLVKNRKFSPDEKHSEALLTIKRDLKSEGLTKSLSREMLDKLEATRFQEDVPLKGGLFAEALTGLIGQLRTEGFPSPMLQRMEEYKGKSFTGEEKLQDALTRVLGPEAAGRNLAPIRERAYLYKVSPWWLILAYAIVTLGELMLSPMGLSLVSKVAPMRLRGLMMGGWFGATAIGNALTMIGVLWNRWLHSSFFILLGLLALVVALVLVVLLRPLKKAMPGV